MAYNNLVTLDHVKSFFSMNEQVQPLDIAPTVTGGLGIDNAHLYPPTDSEIMEKDRTTCYARQYIEEEEQSIIESHGLSGASADVEGGLNDLEELSTAVGDIQTAESLDSETAQQLYSTYYKSNVQYDTNLSIYKYRNQILQLVGINQAVIIDGPTGCGKTTQVPQYILDHHVNLGLHCNIIVTQPRKIAAISVARRVCEERNWQMGGIVGYQVAMDNKISPDTRISFVTTGVLLQKLINNRRMDMYTHVILDEVHERDQDTDFALLVVKKLLRTNSKRVKVILMSATIDASIFANYFSLPGQRDPASIIEIQGKSKEVTEHYLQELSALGIPLPDHTADNPCVPEASYDLVLKLMFIFDKIEKAEQNVPAESEYAPMRGTVLIFLPGYDEISNMTNKLRPAAVSRKYAILPLHSTITVEEQTRVFKPPGPGFRKVIISTNIAESSITVPDIKYVIDFCLTKSLVCDKDTNYSSLQLEWASKANCTQRKGRAGRVDIGRVYRMVTRDFYEHFLPAFTTPEIQRCPLTQTVLAAKKLNLGSPQALLALALEPPALCDIQNAVLTLKQVGALLVTANGIVTPYDGDLTFVGRVMATLPLDVRISKLCLLGYIFNCLEDCIIIAASLSLKSFLSKPFQMLLDSYKSALSWSHGSFSDCITYLNAFRMWKDFSTQGQFKRPGGYKEDAWAKQCFIQLRRIKEVDRLVEEIKNRLEKVNITMGHGAQHREDRAVEELILKLVIAGAFFPYYYCQNPIDEKDMLKEINNNDPLSTVYVSGLPPNHGVLYYKNLYDKLVPCSTRMSITFEDRKAYVTFDRMVLDEDTKPTEGNSILQAVYIAVKMRELRIPLELQVFSNEDAERKMEQLRRLHAGNATDGVKRLDTNRMTVLSTPNINRVRLPPINQLVIEIIIPHVLNPAHFWARYCDPESEARLLWIGQVLNAGDGQNLKPFTQRVAVGMFVIAPYSDVKGARPYYYRAVVEEMVDSERVLVFYIDYGNTKVVFVRDLRYIDIRDSNDVCSTPAFAFECQLSGVKPSAVGCGFSWSEKSKQWFLSKVNGKNLNARVYSVVQDIVRLELYEKNDRIPISINEQLIKKGFAEPVEESLLSKQNFEERARAELMSLNLDEPDSKPALLTPSDLEESMRRTMHKVRLRGPFSPLEVSFSGMTYLDRSRAVKINRDSVNSVTLNPEPQDQHKQVLVASSISLSQRSNTLGLRNTTLLPKIRDLASLLCLIFAPAAEFRTNPKRTAYTGAICGLGYDPSNGQPLYHDHDIEIAFESVMDHEDVGEINRIRAGINMVFKSNDEICSFSSSNIPEVQNRLRYLLLKTVRKNRNPVEPYFYPKCYKWMQVPSEYLLRADLTTSDDVSDVLPLHYGIDLQEDKSIYNELIKKIDHLKEIAGSSMKFEETTCPLCNALLHSKRSVWLHLNSAEHKEKEAVLHKK